jgi:hypothetical protein
VCASYARMKSNSVSVGRQKTDRTTAPVRATPAEVVQEDPEWLDALGVQARFSIRRSLLYKLHHGGHIKSVSLRRRGLQRGTRLFEVDSIRVFLRNQMEAPNEGRK